MTKGIDKIYWKALQNQDECCDPLAVVLGQLKALGDYSKVINEILPSCIDYLSAERKEIVKKTEKTFSDCCCLIDKYSSNDESTYETLIKICTCYEKSKKGG